MGMFKRWFNRMVRNAWEEARAESDLVPVKRRLGDAISNEAHEAAPTINFCLTFAQGGKIITTNHYDRRTDNHVRSVHVIPDEDDFAERVKEIVFKECLSRG